MTLRPKGIVFDADNVSALAEFWHRATGYEVQDSGTWFAHLIPGRNSPQTHLHHQGPRRKDRQEQVPHRLRHRRSRGRSRTPCIGRRPLWRRPDVAWVHMDRHAGPRRERVLRFRRVIPRPNRTPMPSTNDREWSDRALVRIYLRPIRWNEHASSSTQA